MRIMKTFSLLVMVSALSGCTLLLDDPFPFPEGPPADVGPSEPDAQRVRVDAARAQPRDMSETRPPRDAAPTNPDMAPTREMDAMGPMDETDGMEPVDEMDAMGPDAPPTEDAETDGQVDGDAAEGPEMDATPMVRNDAGAGDSGESPPPG